MSDYTRAKEANASITLRHYLMANPGALPTCDIEMKQTTTDSIPFSALEPQQVDFGTAIQHSKKGVLVRVQGTNGEPDYSWKRNVPVFVAIKYPRSIEIIALDLFLLEKEKSIRKSLTYERARELSTISI
jgi:hypothetical protein